MSRVLTRRALDMLDLLPQPLRSQPHFQASMSAQAEQLDKLDAAIGVLRGLVIPITSGDYLYLWESIVGTTTDPDAPFDQRMDVVLAFLSRMGVTGSGSDWVVVANRLLGTGWTYRTRVTGSADPTNPAEHHITVYINTAPPGLTLSMAQAFFDAITPANTVVDIENPDAFALDDGLLDVDEIG